MKNQKTLYYIHDPMCSWCWGFTKTWNQVRNALAGKLDIHYITGGLAADSDQPMPAAMQQSLQDTWRTIQARIPGTEFNFAFWTHCKPRRSTYPACRAVLAARAQAPASERSMITAIQHAYYLQARNPSDDTTLIALASEIGLDPIPFAEQLNSSAINQQLHADIACGRKLGAQGFPSLILATGATRRLLPLDYNVAENILSLIPMGD